jgi:hypothetical protein
MNEMKRAVLENLSKEQLIYLIEQLNRSQFLIGEVCVEESKCHIESDKAVDKIRNYLFNMPNLYDVEDTKAEIDFRMGKISPKKYRKLKGLE